MESLRMSSLSLGLLGALAFGLVACTNLDKSRDAGNPNVSGKTLAVQVCSACHGVTGESNSPMFPKLAGQQKQYLIAQLSDFKGHLRTNPDGAAYMWGFVNLSSSQIDQLADYFSSQAPMHGTKESSPALARGEMIFRSGLPDSGVTQCSACHGAAGEGNGLFPRIGGQHANYIVKQIHLFQKTEQRPRGEPMKQVAHAMTDADTEAVAIFLATFNAAK